jgi:glucokinase
VPRKSRKPVRREPIVLGIDVGATNIRAGLVSLSTGLIRCLRVAKTEASGGAHHSLTRVAALAGEVVEAGRATGLSATKVGIGVPELVGIDGQIDSGCSLPWRARDVRARLGVYGRVTVASDVRAAALAEARLGAGRGEPVFFFVSAGTGLSSTLVIDRRPYAGAHGHAIAFANGANCATCGVDGRVIFECLEERASGLGLVRRASALGLVVPDAATLCRTAHREPGLAREIVDGAANDLAVHVAILANALDPGLIVLGGGLGCAPGRYWSTFRLALRQHTWGPYARRLRVRRAALGVKAGLIGAALSTSEGARE